MAIPDITTLQNIQQLLQNLPQVLQIIQIISYILFIFFLGHIAIKGYKGTPKFYVAFPLKAGLGLASLVIGLSIGSYIKTIPIFNDKLFLLLQADLLIGGIISAFVFALALYLISFRIPVFKIASVGKTIPVLEDRLSRLEATLFRQGILKPGVKENEAKEVAEKAVPGYKTDTAELNNDIWEVLLKKKKKQAFVAVDAYSGRVKDVVIKGLDPVRIAGIAVIIAIVLFGVWTFRGFPNLSEDFYSFIGISPEQFSNLSQQLGNLGTTRQGELDPSCVDIQTLLLTYGQDIINESLPPYSNEQVKNLVEQNSGSTVRAMYRVTHEGKEAIIAVTENSVCSSAQTIFCECLQLQ